MNLVIKISYQLYAFEISSEKRIPVRISRRTKAQTIREGLENATPLGAKLKKNTKTFFTIPYK